MQSGVDALQMGHGLYQTKMPIRPPLGVLVLVVALSGGPAVAERCRSMD
jgi:hypothetical protein